MLQLSSSYNFFLGDKKEKLNETSVSVTNFHYPVLNQINEKRIINCIIVFIIHTAQSDYSIQTNTLKTLFSKFPTLVDSSTAVSVAVKILAKSLKREAVEVLSSNNHQEFILSSINVFAVLSTDYDKSLCKTFLSKVSFLLIYQQLQLLFH